MFMTGQREVESLCRKLRSSLAPKGESAVTAEGEAGEEAGGDAADAAGEVGDGGEMPAGGRPCPALFYRRGEARRGEARAALPGRL